MTHSHQPRRLKVSFRVSVDRRHVPVIILLTQGSDRNEIGEKKVCWRPVEVVEGSDEDGQNDDSGVEK